MASYQGTASQHLRKVLKILSQEGPHKLSNMSFNEYKRQGLAILQHVVDVTERAYPTDEDGFPLFGRYAALAYACAGAFDHVAYIPHVTPTTHTANDAEVFELRDNPDENVRGPLLEMVRNAIREYPMPRVRIGLM
jgi:hypothetical protein